MNFKVTLDERAVDLKLDREGDFWSFTASQDGEGPVQETASVVEVEPGIYSVLMDGDSFEIHVETGDECLFVTVAGRRYEAHVEDPRTFSRISGGKRGEGRWNITCPMPGKVVRVLVAVGDQVAAGQGLLVVEAMKMQNELKAPKSGRVAAIQAREGVTVTAGEILAAIE